MAWSSTRSARRTSSSPERRRLRPVLTVALGAGLVAGVVAPAQAADDDLVTLGATTSATLPPVEKASARFPVVPTDPKAALTPEVVSITSDGFEVVDTSAVSARYDDSTPALVLDVTTDELPDVTTYAVTVRLATTSGQKQSVTVSLVRPPATLAVPATTTWTRTTPLCLGPMCLDDIPWLGTPSDQPPLVVSTDGSSRVVSLRARPPQGDAPRLEVSAPEPTSLPLGPDEDVTLPYSAGPAVPGSVERTATLVSDQLAAPTPVTVTVVTRRPNSLIGLVLVGGALLGWLVRSVLPLAAARSQRLRARATFDAWLAETEAGYDDTAVRTAVDAARRTLGRATDAQAIAVAQKTVTDALAGLETRLGELATQANALEVAARPRRGLEALETQLAEVRAGVTSARTAVASARGDAAAQAVRDARDDLVAAAAAAAPAGTAPLQELASALAGRTQGAQGALAELVGTLRAAPAAPAPGADIDEINTYLDALAVTSRFPSLDAAVRQVAIEATAAYEGLRRRTPIIDEPSIATAARDLQAAVDTGSAASTAPVIRRLNEAYASAAAQIGAAVAAKVATGDVAALTSAHLGADGGQGAEPPVAGETPGPEERTVTEVGPPVLTPRVLSLPVASALSRLGELGLHTLVAVVIVLVTGYALFLPDWLGTNAQLGQVAVWAFAVDTSVAGLALLMAQRTGATAGAPAGTAAPGAPVATPGTTTTTTVTTQPPEPVVEPAPPAEVPEDPGDEPGGEAGGEGGDKGGGEGGDEREADDGVLPAQPGPGDVPENQPVDEAQAPPVGQPPEPPADDDDAAKPVAVVAEPAGGNGRPDGAAGGGT